MDPKVICVVLSLVVLATAGPVVDDTKGHIDNSVKFIISFYFLLRFLYLRPGRVAGRGFIEIYNISTFLINERSFNLLIMAGIWDATGFGAKKISFILILIQFGVNGENLH